MRKCFPIMLALTICIMAFQRIVHESPPEQKAIHESIAKSIPLLEHSSHEFLENAGGCHSCHGQSLGAITFALGLEKGYRYNDSFHQEAVDTLISHIRRQKKYFGEREDPVALMISAGYDS